MIFDYYASLCATLDEQKACPKKVNECGLASGFADECLVWSCQDKRDCQNKRDKKAPDPRNEARRCYMKRASELESLKLPPDLNLEPDFSQLPDPSCFGIEVEFTLLSPWYSKDDRPFHVLDNPVRKDKVFGVPFMSAASWKGLLRWACRMQAGLYGHLESHGMKMDGWKDPAWIVHLFGNERDEGEEFSRGALVFHPTWFDKVNFEVINPHKRGARTGTQPIYYEVVPAGTTGRLRLLYAPLPGETGNDTAKPEDFIDSLIDGITALLETYGISAKRTAGWGMAKIESCTLFLMEGSWLERNTGLTKTKREHVPPDDAFDKLLNENGHPIKVLLDENGELLSKTKWKKLGDRQPSCSSADFEKFKAWYEEHGEEYRRLKSGNKEDEQPLRIRKLKFNSLTEFKTLVEKSKNAGKGGSR